MFKLATLSAVCFPREEEQSSITPSELLGATFRGIPVCTAMLHPYAQISAKDYCEDRETIKL